MIALRVEVPIASFPTSYSREYLETYPVPPPSTVYGMLLSLVGETDRYRYCGVKLAIAMLCDPEKSVTLRKLRRFKQKDINHPTNVRPDYQEILTGIEFVVWVAAGEELERPYLCDHICQAFANPASVSRFGALCLGESQHLVNRIYILPRNEQLQSLKWLIRDECGYLSLPYWVDYRGSNSTRWLQYSLESRGQPHPPDSSWTMIQPI